MWFSMSKILATGKDVIEMNIIIPMTGYGSRFVAAGYKELKPFIPVLGRPIIEWIVKGMYSEEDQFLFVCREEHLNCIDSMRDFLMSLARNVRLYVIRDWIKKGPVYDVLMASNIIDDHQPCMINYCDFYMVWDWQVMKQKIQERNCDGCIPCYTGFHPHLIPKKNLYASCLTDEEDNLIEIREKYSFEEDKSQAKHSPGNYFFRTGNLMKKYCQKLVDSKQDINGEYYVSMTYNFMVADGLKVWIPTDVKYFCQWGTPEDLEESKYWIEIMRNNVQ